MTSLVVAQVGKDNWIMAACERDWGDGSPDRFMEEFATGCDRLHRTLPHVHQRPWGCGSR